MVQASCDKLLSMFWNLYCRGRKSEFGSISPGTRLRLLYIGSRYFNAKENPAGSGNDLDFSCKVLVCKCVELEEWVESQGFRAWLLTLIGWGLRLFETEICVNLGGEAEKGKSRFFI